MSSFAAISRTCASMASAESSVNRKTAHRDWMGSMIWLE